jgi:hypothetical protein
MWRLYLQQQAISFCCHECVNMFLTPFSLTLGAVLISMQVLTKVAIQQKQYLAICDRKVLTHEFFTSKYACE